MTRTGSVANVEGNAITVALADASCDGCSTPCGACRREQKPLFAKVVSDVSVEEGDRVELSCSSAVIVWYSFLLFCLPLFCGIAAAFLASASLGEGNGALVGALVALAVLFLGAAVLSLPRLREKNRFRITRLLCKKASEKELDK